MTRRLVVLVLLLTMETGCPHAWGRGGTIEVAPQKDGAAREPALSYEQGAMEQAL